MRPCADGTAHLSEHLKGFSVVLLNPEAVADALETWLGKYGPVKRVALDRFGSAIQYLTPLKSFTTRFVVLGWHDKALLLNDMQGENCHVDAFAISRMTGCSALGVMLKSQRREFQLYERGAKIREVQSLQDGDRWYYREEGALQPFEELAACVAPRKRDRLRTEILVEYFHRYVGFPAPDWRPSQFTQSIGLERSIRDVRDPICEFRTVVDLDISATD